MHKLRVLICDDAEHVRIAHEAAIIKCAKAPRTERELFYPMIETTTTGEEGVKAAREAMNDGAAFDLILMDVDFGQAQGKDCMDGFQAAEKIHRILPNAVIGMISAYSTDENYRLADSVQHISKFLRRGIFRHEELLSLCKYALVHSLHARNALLRPDQVTFTESVVMKDYLDRLDQIPEDESVFVQGETGTGKMLAAERLNANAKVLTGNTRREFVKINCGGFTPTLLMGELFGHVRGAYTGADRDRAGWLEQAEGGDVFLDELQNASLEFQQALLDFLQTGNFSRVGESKVRKVNARVIVAFNVDPMKAIQAGTLREDLFGRLQKNFIVIPPLRERKGDIRALVQYFQKQHSNADKTFSEDALEFLETFPWYTNVRGIKAVVEKIIACSKLPVITKSSLLALPAVTKVIAKQQAPEDASPVSVRPDLPEPTWDDLAEKVTRMALEQGKSFDVLMKDLERATLKVSFETDPVPARIARRLKLSDSTLRRKLIEHRLVEVEPSTPKAE